MKNLKIFLRDCLKKIFPNMSLEQWEFIRKAYVFYAKCGNIIRYGDYNFFTGISIETSTYCNRKCQYCPNYKHETPTLYADEKIIYKALDDLGRLKYGGWISFSFYNEPSLDDRLKTFFKYAKKKVPNATIMMISNGDFLNTENTKEYKESGVDQFIITIHDKNRDKLFDKLSKIRDGIGYSFHIQSLGPKNLITRAGEIELKETKPLKYCDYIRNPVIDKNGNMLMCCNDYFRINKMGNILENSILEIWNNPRYINIRRELRKDITRKRSKIVPDLCVKCFNSMNRSSNV